MPILAVGGLILGSYIVSAIGPYVDGCIGFCMLSSVL